MTKKGNDSKKLKLLIVVGIILIILICLLCSLKYFSKKLNSEEESTETTTGLKSYSEFKSVKEIIEYSRSKYIEELKCDENGYDYKHSVEFEKPLYENDVSNEKYFNAIITRILHFYNYKKCFILIDESNNIEIKVQCNGGEVVQILINGEKDYFLRHDNLIAKKNSKSDSYTDLVANSQEIKDIIKNNWNYNKSIFGEIDSQFTNYDIFGDEGIEVRVINNKVYNIVFNTNYEGNVINNIKTNYTVEDVIDKLGSPTFGSIEESAIGYKCKDFYVIFANDQIYDNSIAIYRNEQVDCTEFEELLKKYVDGETNLKEFTNSLTYLWPDYSSYSYNSSYVDLVYPIQGVEVNYGYLTDNNVVIYENYIISDYINELVKKGKVLLKSTESLIFDLEAIRLENISYMEMMAYEFQEEENYHYTSSKYNYLFDRNDKEDIIKVLFISNDKSNYYNKELNESINNGYFIDDDNFVYSIKNKGIYLFNVITNEKQTLVEGNEEYELKEYNGKLVYYDDTSISLE